MILREKKFLAQKMQTFLLVIYQCLHIDKIILECGGGIIMCV